MADSEAVAACGGWAVTIPTALTVQNCHNVSRVMPADPGSMRQMAEAVSDMQIAAIKLGLLADEATLRAAEQIIRRFPGVPVVADPVLKAGGGRCVIHSRFTDALPRPAVAACGYLDAEPL